MNVLFRTCLQTTSLPQTGLQPLTLMDRLRSATLSLPAPLALLEDTEVSGSLETCLASTTLRFCIPDSSGSLAGSVESHPDIEQTAQLVYNS